MPGPYGFVVPSAWNVGTLRNSGGPASFAHIQDPSGRDHIDYEVDGTGSVYGPDHRPDMSRLAAATNTADGGAGPLGCPLIGEGLVSGDELLYSCSTPSPAQVVSGVLAVDPYPAGFHLLQASFAEPEYAAADQIVASLPAPAGHDPLPALPACSAAHLTRRFPSGSADSLSSRLAVL